MMAHELTTPRHADSPYVRARAHHLAVAWRGNGWFDVASGTSPGVVYHVHAPLHQPDADLWQCDCLWAEYGGTGCSHVRAAARFAAAARRRVANRRSSRRRAAMRPLARQLALPRRAANYQPSTKPG